MKKIVILLVVFGVGGFFLIKKGLKDKVSKQDSVVSPEANRPEHPTQVEVIEGIPTVGANPNDASAESRDTPRAKVEEENKGSSFFASPESESNYDRSNLDRKKEGMKAEIKYIEDKKDGIASEEMKKTMIEMAKQDYQRFETHQRQMEETRAREQKEREDEMRRDRDRARMGL